MALRRMARRNPRNDWTAAELRAHLDYNPATGEFTTKPRPIGYVQHFGRTRVPAVTIHLKAKDGVWRMYYAHRLAWLWMTGEWPEAEVDHVNNISTDNRWENLRAATHTENNRNKDFAKPNGLVGAHLHKPSGRWRATFRHRHLGYFNSAEEAAEAYRKAAIAEYGDFAHMSIKTERLP